MNHPLPLFTIDFETYWSKKEKISAGDLGLRNYVKKSYAYLVSLCDGVDAHCGTIEEMTPMCKGVASMGGSFIPCAANSNFDQIWWEELFGPLPNDWFCILDQAAQAQLPRNLADLSRVITGNKLDKSLRDFMNGKHWKDLSEKEKTDVERYCLDDARHERTLADLIPNMTPIEQRIASHTRMMNRRGIAVDEDMMDKHKTAMEKAKFEACRDLPWAGEYEPLSPRGFSEFCDKNGIPVPTSTAKDDEDCEYLVSQHPLLAGVLDKMRLIRQTNVTIRKIQSIQARLTDGSIMPMEMLYCGAPHTRRWSSRGVNMQNLTKEPIVLTQFSDPKELAAAKKAIKKGNPPPGVDYVYMRHWFVPRPGKIFLILDYSQIEPRCLNWLAGNDAMLDLVRQGFSVYEAFARAAGRWAGNVSLKEGNPALYHDIKAQVLGLGYGMGASRFADETGKPIDAAKMDVNQWRGLNPKILGLWSMFDKLIDTAVRERNGKNDLSITLPTGDFLRYFDIKCWTKGGGNGTKPKRGFSGCVVKGDYSKESLQTSLWGGTLTENVTQRMARDVLAESVLKLEAAGLPVVFTAHDEVIIEVDNDATKDDARKTAEEILGRSPDWAPGLPLGVEGDFATRYTKL